MSLVDTNIILRYLLNDIPEQSEIARLELKSGNVKILTQIVAEVIYVLSKIYKINRKEISENLLKIFSLNGVIVENEEIVVFAVAEYGNSKIRHTPSPLHRFLCPAKRHLHRNSLSF